jgi:membrane fusion protein (multidrug efflux system)
MSDVETPLVPEADAADIESERREGPRRDVKRSKLDRQDSAPGDQARTTIDKRSLLRGHPVAAALAILLLIGAVVGGVWWWLSTRGYESTDDAFIATRPVTIGSQVSAAVTAVPVSDNQEVEAGTVLVRLDARDFQAAVDQAQAQVEQAKASIANLGAQIDAQQLKIDAAEKQTTEAQAALGFSRQENERSQALVKRGAGTEQRAQQASSDLQQKQAAYAAAKATAIGTQKQIAVLRTQRQGAEGQLHQAQAQVEQAKANLSRTTITAPVAGRISNLTAAKGELAQTGQALMMLVPREMWVTANFKETQLTQMRPGQPVTIHIDSYPGRTFNGHVDSIQAGSGTAFSLLPAENATGNFVKVVQRMPVKIVFDQQPDVLLGPGMSVEPTVKVQ